MPEGHQSPPPERQTGAQLGDPPGSGKGPDLNKASKEDPKHQLDCLTSNPKGPMDDALEQKFSKETGNFVKLNM
ncbi:hypothetical protein TARUN_5523 [Trichoderma arundinaceum]|uniref:Uncharacterized protein n=1 Tax=Trichoderma arundinaceum TaxID=490622 RepID=A0A395NKZ1_TRIAR|nr:hypothetical protein TARUN_5523 [Trichoderma arundinaceum]